MVQFPLPHCRGSSHGQSRLVRYGYPEPFHTALMPEAFQMWDEVGKKAGRNIIRFGLHVGCFLLLNLIDVVITGVVFSGGIV